MCKVTKPFLSSSSLALQHPRHSSNKIKQQLANQGGEQAVLQGRACSPSSCQTFPGAVTEQTGLSSCHLHTTAQPCSSSTNLCAQGQDRAAPPHLVKGNFDTNWAQKKESRTLMPAESEGEGTLEDRTQPLRTTVLRGTSEPLSQWGAANPCKSRVSKRSRWVGYIDKNIFSFAVSIIYSVFRKAGILSRLPIFCF